MSEGDRPDFFNAHGTSTPLGDELELGAVRRLFGNAIANVSMSSTKSAIGHLLGGAGAVESIYFHPAAGGWSEDFAREPLLRQGFFIHEMTHVWQAQKGGRLYLPLMRHPFCRYSYAIRRGKAFRSYGIEQQAEIVRHRFLADRGMVLPATPPATLLPFAR
jgi:hypothetical protein